MTVHQIRITGTGSELQGVGRADDGRAVFVPGALPGECVEVENIRQAPRFCEGRLHLCGLFLSHTAQPAHRGWNN